MFERVEIGVGENGKLLRGSNTLKDFEGNPSDAVAHLRNKEETLIKDLAVIDFVSECQISTMVAAI